MKRKISLYLPFIIVFISLLLSVQPSPVLMTQQIGSQIFNEEKYYLIYVYEEPTPTVQQLFSSYCQNKTTCAVLNATVQQYMSVRQFVGKQGNQFFLILNVPFRKKYVLDINPKKLTKQKIQKFQRKYHSGKLKPFYASQKAPATIDPICKQLVGSTFDNYLYDYAPLKVVYTYTKNGACQACVDLLKGFQMLAEKVYKQEIINFGYIDIFLNDVPSIPEPIVPNFYIYSGKQIIRQIHQTEFENLYQIILQQINKVLMRKQQENSSEDSSRSSDQNSSQL